MYFKRVILGLMFSALVNLATAADQKLTGEQIRSLYVGKTFHVAWTNGKLNDTGTETLSSKGSVSRKMKSGFADQGTWTINGDKLCQNWKKAKGGCFPVYIIGDKHIWKAVGEQTTFSH